MKKVTRSGVVSVGLIIAIAVGGLLLSFIGSRTAARRAVEGRPPVLFKKAYERRHPVPAAKAPAAAKPAQAPATK